MVEGFCKLVLEQDGKKDKFMDRLIKVEKAIEGLGWECMDTSSGVIAAMVDMANDNARIIIQLKEELATANKLIDEQRNWVGPMQKADENQIIQLIKMHTKINSSTLQEIVKVKQHFGNSQVTG